MKFATLRTGEVVALTEEGYRRVNRSSMIDLIENYPSQLTFSGDPIELPDRLAPPIAKPSKIWAAAGDYHRVNTKNRTTGAADDATGGLFPADPVIRRLFRFGLSGAVVGGHRPAALLSRCLGEDVPHRQQTEIAFEPPCRLDPDQKRAGGYRARECKQRADAALRL